MESEPRRFSLENERSRAVGKFGVEGFGDADVAEKFPIQRVAFDAVGAAAACGQLLHGFVIWQGT